MVQRSYGLHYFFQVPITDKVLEVAASLFYSGSHRQIVKRFQRRRLSGQELSGNKDLVRVLSSFADRQGFESGIRGKGLRHLEMKRLCVNLFLKKIEKDSWAEWGPIFVVLQSRFCLIIQKSEVKGSTFWGIVECG